MIEPDAARERALEILDRSEFQEPEPGRLGEAWDSVWEWLGDLFSFPIGSGGGGVASAIVWVLLLAAIVGLVWVLATNRWRTGGRREVRPTVTASTVAGKTAVEWDAVADQAERQGDWAAAVRARYRAVVARLADRRLVRSRPGSTSGEHRADVAQKWPAGEDPFTDAAERFDEVWYGGSDAGPADSDDLKSLARLADDAPAGGRGSRG